MLYKELVELYEKLDSTSKRLEKTYYLSKLIKKTGKENLREIILLARGKIFPDWDESKIGISTKIAIKAINKTTGISEKDIIREWKKLGDLGDVSEALIKKKKQTSLFSKELTVNQVFLSLQSLALSAGKGSIDEKLNIICDLLINSSPREAKYLVRTIIDNMRIGIGSSTIRDAIVWAYFSEELGIIYDSENITITVSDRERYNEYIEKIQHAYDLTNDFAKVTELIKEKGIEGIDKLSLELGYPVNVMLFQKAKSIEDAFNSVGRPAAFEYKYDGFRVQVHKSGSDIKLFTRKLEEVTQQFPEIVSSVKTSVNSSNIILDAEAVGYDPKTKKYIPFQNISQRIRRKYYIHEMAEKFPVELNVFDILYLDGKNLLSEPFEKRRALLEKIIDKKEKKIVLAKQIITDKNKEAEEFYQASLKLGEEGVMAKSLQGKYKPGSRVGYGVKIKPILEPLDLVIVGAEYGEGKRSGWLTSFILACSDNGDFKEIGRVSTGLKELEEEGITFKNMTELLKPLITKSKGKSVEVSPEIVIEVGYEEIQKSINYDSGYALRFPRFLRLRTDEKTVKEINTLEDVEKYYYEQRSRNK